ncbi:hypothetical protein PybrP1_003782 [[Pythium] brassicae (nom. inval.)]|nr:hypothetical protein PybrP1_003782 [[Pythium] brassicae (nom. inval.)]
MAPSLVVQRERRRPRKSVKSKSGARGSSTSSTSKRRGFVFQDDAPNGDEVESDGRGAGDVAMGGDDVFVFRAKRSPKHTMDASTASAALLSKKERTQKAEERRQRALKKKQDKALEAAYVQQLERKLSPDQLDLYQIMHAQVARELRKTYREFESSTARKDIFHLTERSLQALKEEMVAFMVETPPADTSTTLPNPENARLRALLDTYEKRLQDMDDEEQQWKAAMERIEGESSADDEEAEATTRVVVPCELPVAKAVAGLQQQALQQIGSTAQKLELMDDSVQSVDRLILQIEMKKAKLFTTFHETAFKGYAHITQPKENLRALLNDIVVVVPQS